MPTDEPIHSPRVGRQVIDVKELAEMIGASPSHIYSLLSRNGHVLNVQPIEDVGRRRLFSRVLIERALNCEPQGEAEGSPREGA